MKKNVLFLGLCGVLASVGAQAQNTPLPSKSLSRDKHPATIQGLGSSSGVSRAVIWEDDFSDPATWTVSNTGSPSRNWTIDSIGPTGDFSESMGKIESTSGGNFAMFDSDALGSGTSVQNAVVQNLDPIDLSSHPNVLIEFESYYRAFDGACYLEASADGGATWTQIPLHTNITGNTNTTNPEVVIYNISSAIGGSATAHIRFRYIGGWDYAWMVDDVKIMDAPDNELVLTKIYSGDYTKYPLSQIRPITLTGNILNRGSLAQTNVKLEVKENGASIGISPVVASLASVATDSLIVTEDYEPSGVGVKNLEFTLSQTETDEIPTNNTLNASIEVHPTQFSRDHVRYGGSGYGGLSIGANGDPVTGIGSPFEIVAPTTAVGINFVLDRLTTADSEVRVELFDASGTSLVSVGESDLYKIEAADINTAASNTPVSVTLNFIVPIDLQPGFYVAAVWEDLGSVSVAYEPFNRHEDIFIFSGGSWGGLIDGGYTPLLRLNLQGANNSSVNESDIVSNISVFPNPATDAVNITFNELGGDATLTMFSMDGKQVINKNVNVVANQTATLDVSGLTSGVYTLRVASSHGTTSQKVIIK